MSQSLAVHSTFAVSSRPFRVQMMDVDDKALLDAWAAGDVAAFTALYTRHNARIVAYCAKIVNDVALAEDIAHRSWEKLIERRSKRIDSPVGFLLRAAKNLAIDHTRRSKYTSPLSEITEHATPTSALSERETVVIECLDELKEQTREILVLHYYSGYSFEEIATMMKMKPNAIYTRVSRARVELKARVERKLAAPEKIGGQRS